MCMMEHTIVENACTRFFLSFTLSILTHSSTSPLSHEEQTSPFPFYFFSFYTLICSYNLLWNFSFVSLVFVLSSQKSLQKVHCALSIFSVFKGVKFSSLSFLICLPFYLPLTYSDYIVCRKFLTTWVKPNYYYDYYFQLSSFFFFLHLTLKHRPASCCCWLKIF